MWSHRYLYRILTVIVFCVTVNQSFAEEPFYLVDSGDAVPFKSENSFGEPEGIFYDIISRAFVLMGVPLKYEVYPWKRAQMYVKMQEADALITVPTPERLKYLIPSKESIYTSRIKLFTQRDNPNKDKIQSITSISDLKGLKILSFIGNGWGEKTLKNFEVDWAPNLSSMCKKLAAYRGDVFLENETVVLYTVKNLKQKTNNSELKFDHIVSFDIPIESYSFHLLIHKNSKYLYLLPQFDQTIKTMRESGELERIMDKWIK